MESLLKRIFDFGVFRNDRYVCHWVDKGQHWYICPTTIYTAPDPSPDIEVQSYNGGHVPDKLKENPSLAYPENFWKVVVEDLPEDFQSFFWGDGYVYSFKSGKILEADAKLPFRHHYFIDMVTSNWNEFDKVSLGTHNGMNPLLKVTQGEECLWVMPIKKDIPEKLELNINGVKIVPSDWSDKDKCYKKLRKEKKMGKLENFDELVKSTLGATPAEVQPKDPAKTGKENPVEIPKAQEAPEAPKEVALAEPAEVKEPVKRTRKKAETTPLTDLTKVIEQLSGAIPDKMSSDDALKAIRQLRDLQLAAARRAANISLQYIENTEGAVAKLAAIKAQL